jgi:hypothetical protein
MPWLRGRFACMKLREIQLKEALADADGRVSEFEQYV